MGRAASHPVQSRRQPTCAGQFVLPALRSVRLVHRVLVDADVPDTAKPIARPYILELRHLPERTLGNRRTVEGIAPTTPRSRENRHFSSRSQLRAQVVAGQTLRVNRRTSLLPAARNTVGVYAASFSLSVGGGHRQDGGCTDACRKNHPLSRRCKRRSSVWSHRHWIVRTRYGSRREATRLDVLDLPACLWPTRLPVCRQPRD